MFAAVFGHVTPWYVGRTLTTDALNSLLTCTLQLAVGAHKCGIYCGFGQKLNNVNNCHTKT